MSRPRSRPLKFQSVEELQAKIDEYFADKLVPKQLGDTFYYEPITITGLALALDTSRETLCNYELRDDFFDTVRRAKLRVEEYAERQLYLGKSAAGPIFALKNHGWSDKQQVEQSGSLTIHHQPDDAAILERFLRSANASANDDADSGVDGD